MGDRAVLALKSQPTIGVYLHWNGSPEEVKAILADVASYARKPGDDATYALARLVEACCNRAGPRKETSVGVAPIGDLDCDNGDNGLYWIGDDWKIVGREHAR
jgi:hypothetical protein